MKKRLLALILVIAAVSCVLVACNSGDVTITFDPRNGEDKIVVKVDDNFRLPDEPVRAGYTFTGWYKDEDCQLEWNVPQILTKSITVYAGWTADSAGGDELSAVFANYDNYSKWNFQVTYSAYADNQLQMQDVLQFKGYDIAMQYADYNSSATYVDYLIYDGAKGQNAYYIQDDDGKYVRYYEEDDATEYEQVYQMDYVELCNLKTLAFTKNGGKYSAVDPVAAGNEILGSYEGETYTSLDIYVASGKITQITAASNVVDATYGNYAAKYELVFSKYGQVSFTAPEVGSTGSGELGDEGESTTNTSKFKDKNLTVDSGCLEYTVNQTVFGYDSTKGLQFSKKDNIVFTSKTQVTGVKSVEVTCCTNVTNGILISVYVGNTELEAVTTSTVGKDTSKNTTLQFYSSTPLSGAVRVEISNGGSKSVYVLQIAVTGTGVGGSGSGTTPSETVTLNKYSITLEVDGTDVLVATASSGGEISWSSSDTGVATVMSGTVTGVATGTATITVTCGTASASCTVRVVDATEFLGWNVATPSGVQTPVLQNKMMQVDNAVGLPSVGTYDVLVIPVEFTDALYTEKQLSDLDLAFNDTTGATGWESVKSFYNKSSDGKLNLNFSIVGVNFGYKGQIFNTGDKSTNYSKTDDEKPLIERALAQLDAAGADLSKFDSNGDGCIDAVYMMYSRDFDNTGNADLWWAYVYYYGTNSNETYSVDGVQPYFYFWASQNFMYDDTTSSVPINAETFIHETGHLLGLDDYYDYEENTGSDQGVGGAAMMDYNMGDHDPYSKLMLGWITPTVISSTTAGATINLSDTDKNNDVLLIRLDSGTDYLCEYLLIDVYNNTGLNAWRTSRLYGGASFGARIFHISSAVTNPYQDDGYGSFTNDNNSVSTNPLIKLIEADGGNSKFAGSNGLAQASDLWKTNGTLTNCASYYTSKKVTVTFSAVSATGATVSVTYN
ncbi:MAG: InlB B-repeat-containing protein [Corallococcus sp.]|nr:InlB B-repeat-containing protein [Corallococcus sp.]MCM1358936.1 InlB B-repeat-containing protein [Corallococcus sp.]MCM1394924.1 InlB B-repeat-containing protein [Corallococcus sp.]